MLPDPLAIPLALIGAYVIGSIDFAVVVGRMHGVDIRQVGSGNPGTSNVLRTLGRGPAAMVFVGDLLKGVIGAALGTFVGGDPDPRGALVFAAGLAAVVGHCYPVFHRFRGGKGVATGAGVMLFAVPLGGLVLATVWGLVVGLGRVASIGSLVVVALAVPVALWQGVTGVSLALLAVTLALILWRHRDNIRRMVGGGERKVTS